MELVLCYFVVHLEKKRNASNFRILVSSSQEIFAALLQRISKRACFKVLLILLLITFSMIRRRGWRAPACFSNHSVDALSNMGSTASTGVSFGKGGKEDVSLWIEVRSSWENEGEKGERTQLG